MAVMPARSPGRTPFPLGHWPWGDSFDPPLESFALPPLGGDKFGEGDSIAGKAAPLLEGLSRISKLLSQLCPEAVPSSVASDSRTFQFEGLLVISLRLVRRVFNFLSWLVWSLWLDKRSGLLPCDGLLYVVLVFFSHLLPSEAVLSHFLAHIGPHFRAHLVSSSFAGPYLFNDEALSQVLTASHEDSAVSANIALTKAVLFPVFGAGKSDRKVSFDRSSNASSSSSPSRGRGRGSVAERFCRSSNSSSSSSSTLQEQ